MHPDITLPTGSPQKRVSAKATPTFYFDDIDVEVDLWRRATKSDQPYRFIVILKNGRDPDVEYILSQPEWPGVEPSEWTAFQEAVRTSPPYIFNTGREHAEPAATEPAGDKLYQRILRLAYNAAAPDRSRVPPEIVRPHFVQAYPQGRDTTAKDSAAALRQAWARALKSPPPDIVVSGGYIYAKAA